MTTPSDHGWSRPSHEPRHPLFAGSGAESLEAETDLDWIRSRIVELDDRQRALPPTDIAARHALLEATDGLRTMLRSGLADELHAVREAWEARAGRKGDHEVDYEAIAGMVRSMATGDAAS